MSDFVAWISWIFVKCTMMEMTLVILHQGWGRNIIIVDAAIEQSNSLGGGVAGAAIHIGVVVLIMMRMRQGGIRKMVCSRNVISHANHPKIQRVLYLINDNQSSCFPAVGCHNRILFDLSTGETGHSRATFLISLLSSHFYSSLLLQSKLQGVFILAVCIALNHALF